MRQQSLHRNVGIVQQDVFLFAASIMENIRYGRPDATADEVLDAARRAEIYDDIMSMPDGFDTYVGERGVLLSDNQRGPATSQLVKGPLNLGLRHAVQRRSSLVQNQHRRVLEENPGHTKSTWINRQ